MIREMKPLVVAAKHILTPVAAPIVSPMWSKLRTLAREASGSSSGPDTIMPGRYQSGVAGSGCSVEVPVVVVLG